MTLIISLTGTLTLVLASMAIIAYDWSSSRDNLESQTQTLVEVTAENIAASLIFRDREAAESTLSALKPQTSIVRAYLYDTLDDPIAFYHRDGTDFEAPAMQPFGATFTDSHLDIFHPITFDGEQVGTIYVISDLASIKQRLRNYIALIAALVFVSIILVVLIGSSLQKIITGPILNLAESAHSISEAKDYSVRAAIPRGKDEVGLLVNSFNEMLEQIESSSADLERENTVRSQAEDALRRLNDELEERIKERTAEYQHAKEIAETASRHKSDFLANMSHELRTPMNAIIGMNELVMETVISKDQRSYLSMAQEAADMLLQLLNDTLDFSKIEAGKMTLEPVLFNLRDSMAGILKGLAVSTHSKDLDLIFGVNPEAPICLIGDPGRLRQIIVNLVSNAIKFTQHGEIELYIQTEHIPDDSILLHGWVRDTGIGIPIEDQQRIFETFSQADDSTTRQYGGTGLGLAISTQLAALMQGSIWVESQFGIGSTFQFNARFAIAPDQSPVSTVSSAQRVLVIMPNESERHHVVDQLHFWGALTTLSLTTEAAQQAIESADEPFSLVLLDYHMGPLEWIDSTIRLLRARRSTTTIAMLERTGTQHDSLDIDLRIFKPVAYAELLAAVDGSYIDELRETASNGTEAAITQQPLDVLLVEDTPANQHLVSALLEKNGHAITIANNGREALDLFARHAYDVVLMDVQMPAMDGLTATEEIRRHEAETGAHTPRIAMTARAMQGDEERCREAGMDAYLTKPIRIKGLLDILQKTVPSEPSAPLPITADTNESTASGESDSDLFHTMLEQTGEDEELLAELIDYVLDSGPDLLTQIERAVEAQDAEQIEQIAHKLKGTVSILGTSPCFDAAEVVEHAARNNALPTAEEKLGALKEVFAHYSKQLEGFAARINT